MLARNVKNNQLDIPEHLQQYAFYQDESGTLPLTISKEYVVSGIRYIGKDIFYLIVPDIWEQKCYPWWYPSSLFSIVDESIPDDWVIGGVEGDKIHTFPELSKDPTNGSFESNLEDGDATEIAIFKKYYEKYNNFYGNNSRASIL